MSSYKKYIISSAVLVSLVACNSLNLEKKEIKTVKETKKEKVNIQTKKYESEDKDILFALEYEKQGEDEFAQDLYKKLFLKTNKYEYLSRFVSIAFKNDEYKDIVKLIDKNTLSNLEKLGTKEGTIRGYSYSLSKQGQIDKALKIMNKLVDKSPNSKNYSLLGALYLESEDYQKAANSFEKAYKEEKDVSTLLSLAKIKYHKLDKKDEAKKYIEDFLNKNGYTHSYKLNMLLAYFYEEDKNSEKLYSLLNKMYKDYKIHDDENYFESVRKMMFRYLFLNKDLDKTINFAKENNEDEFLFDLYMKLDKKKEAYEVLKKLYKKSKDDKYLGDLASFEFELAQNKKEVIDEVIKKFEKALKYKEDSVHQNYLAYLLIDYDIDVNKGLVLVKKALKVEPENIAYIDTQAWGEYKINNCSKAYELMKKVVDKIGLEDEEVKLHWEKIKECKK